MSPIERLKPLYASPPSRGVCPALIRLFNLNQILAQKKVRDFKNKPRYNNNSTYLGKNYRILENCTVAKI